MGIFGQEIEFENRLIEEHPRLVRLCAWFTGNPESAEDLAQETLLAAWKNRARLESMNKLKPWVSGIARNICLSWSRGHIRELARRVAPPPLAGETPVDGASDAVDDGLEYTLADDSPLDQELDRAELARLLEKALALLPAETARLLVEHYIQEASYAEIAEKFGIHPSAVAMRLQRGKLSLQRLMRTRLQAESAAFGLLNPAALSWEETNIWCPACGQVRMLGQYQKHEPQGRYALRCPLCSPDPHDISVGLDLTNPYNAALLGNLKSYKPAYTRLITSLTEPIRQAIAGGSAACPSCGGRAVVTVEHRLKHDGPPHEISDIYIVCHACGWASKQSRSGLIMALPETQRFWRNHPRIRTLPSQEVETQGTRSVVTRIQSVTSTAGLAVVSTRDTFEVLAVHSGG